MAKHEPIERSRDAVKVRLSSKPIIKVNIKMIGMRWKRVAANGVEFFPGSFDETIFNSDIEGDPPFTTEKKDILSDLSGTFKNDWQFVDQKILDAKTNFLPVVAVYARLPSAWIDLIINHTYNGIPDEIILIRGLIVRKMINETDLSCVSDTKNFAVYEEIKNIENSVIA